MKKIMTLAAIFAAVMMGFSACQPEDQPSTPGTEETPGTNEETPGEETPGTNEETPGTNEETPGEDEYVSPITIDGNFEDWDAIDPAKLAVATNNSETNGALKVLKVYADESILNVYVELDPDFVTCRCSEAPCEHFEEPGNPLDLFFSTSKDAGGYNAFSDMCVEYFVQGTLFENGEFTSWDGGMYMWIGEVHAEGWSWEEVLPSIGAQGAGSGDKYELAIMMEMIGGVMDLTGDLYLGAVLEQGWDIAGCLPNAPVTDTDNTGKAEMLKVIINK